MSTAAVIQEQLLLFQTGVDVLRLREAREVYMGATKSVNTRAAYRSSWKRFSAWCVDAGRSSLPSSAETVSLYVAQLLEDRYRLETVRVHLSSIADRHAADLLPSPVTQDVRLLVSNAARLLRERPQNKAALTLDQLRRLMGHLRGSTSSAAARDAAILLLGFSSGWRRSELSSLDYADVSFDGERAVTLRLGASKCDQEGKGRVVTLPAGKRSLTCPVRGLLRWIEDRGRWRGPLFCRVERSGALNRQRLSGAHMCTLLQTHLTAIGEDSTLFGGHSLRSGMATVSAENGGDTMAIMQRGGWKSLATVLRYIRPAQAFRNDPLRGVL